jgi:ankyrin repeat protein
VGLLDAPAIVAMLLEHGANPNAELTQPMMQRQHTFGDGSLGKGATPLLRAAKSGDIVLVKALIAAGADPKHAMPNGATALMYAAGLGWRNGSALAPSYDQGTDAEAVETIEFLLTQGLSLGDQDKDGNTALHLAVAGRASDTIITYLVKEAGADPSIRNVKDQTVLAAAKAKRDGAAVVALLESLGVTDSVVGTAAGAE